METLEALTKQLSELENKNRKLDRLVQRQQQQLERQDKIAHASEQINLSLYGELDKLSKELESERQKAEQLLLNILPASIAERLKQSPDIIADGIPEATVLFADIVGFTPLSEKIPPQQLVRLLNDLFSAFDDLTVAHRLEKIKTVGDAYVVAGGVPDYRADHASAIADLALVMQAQSREFAEKTGQPITIRIGINSGPVVAGVIGKKKYAYDLYGDTVNTAARMESSGVPGEIQVSTSAYELLKDAYKFTLRGELEIKGKGLMVTYLLNRRK
jgi:adenylate cyclase